MRHPWELETREPHPEFQVQVGVEGVARIPDSPQDLKWGDRIT